MKTIDTLLFDLDGTLIDTNEIIIKSYRHAFNTHFPEVKLSRQDIIDRIGPPLETIFRMYTDSPFKVKDAIDTYRTYYTRNEAKYHTLYPNVYETIKDLKEMGFNLGIVTSKFKEAALPSFSHYGLDKYFDVFIALDDVKEPKPSAEPVLKALNKFPGYKGAIMIGDNQGDILSGQNANIYSAGVAWSIKGVPHLKEVNPDYILYKMSDLITIVNKLNEEA